MDRKTLNKRLVELAEQSPCKKRKVGAVVVGINGDNDYKIVGEGFNHVLDNINEPCEQQNGNTKKSVIHAEIDAMNNAKLIEPTSFNGNFFLYVTHEPCDDCLKAINEEGLPYEVIDTFLKFSATKPRMALVPASLGISAARALTYGAKKYKPNNWKKAETIEDYISAFQRHFDAWREGEENETDSGLSHLDHLAANLAFLIELKHLPKIKES